MDEKKWKEKKRSSNEVIRDNGEATKFPLNSGKKSDMEREDQTQDKTFHVYQRNTKHPLSLLSPQTGPYQNRKRKIGTRTNTQRRE